MRRFFGCGKISNRISQNDQGQGIIITGQSLSGDMIPAISKSLRNNSIMLQQLALCHNPIGNDGIQSLISALVINKSLKVLDLSDCNIGIPGLESLFQALKQNQETNLSNLNLSHNVDIFNVQGGQIIVKKLEELKTLKKLLLQYIYMEKNTNGSGYNAFVGKLVGYLCYHPTSHWPIVLSLPGFQSYCAIEYFQKGFLHSQIHAMELLSQSIL